MNPFEALQILNDATGKLVADRDTHVRVQSAINALANYLQTQTPLPKTVEAP